jgi:hypothetical protein
MAVSFSADIASGKAKAERLHQEIQQLQVLVLMCVHVLVGAICRM